MSHMEDFSEKITQRAEKLIELHPFLIVGSDEPHMIRYANVDFLEVFDSTEDEIISRSLLDFFVDDKCDLTKSNNDFSCEFVNSKKKKFKVKLCVRNIEGLQLDGKAVIVDIVFKDEEEVFFDAIKKRCETLREEFKHIDEEGQRWKLAVEGSQSGVWDWNAEENISFFSDEWKQMLGYSPDEIGNNPMEWDSRVHSDDREGVLRKLEEHIKGKTEYYSAVYRMVKKDGQCIWVHDRGKIVERTMDGIPRRMVGLQIDISDRIRIEKQLEIAKIQAEQASAIKGRFLANMTHELRTPLNGIIGITDILLEKKHDTETCENLKSITFSANSLLEIINEILDFSKIESGKMGIEKICFNFTELLKKIENSFLPMVKNKGLDFSVRIEYDEYVYIKGDPLRLRQILFNLIGNAIKFTENGGVEVTVDFGKTEKTDADNLIIKVKDTGIGISKTRIDTIFDAYSQAETYTARKYGGTGLGLSITKSLVELMKGRISVISEEEKGTEFTVEIPCEFCTEYYGTEVETLKKAAPVNFSGKRILIADDNSINIKILRHFLDNTGAEIMALYDGISAVNELKKNKYDILLLDVEMPGMNGFDTAAMIRADESNRNMVIMIVTAHDKSIGEECLKNGIDGVIYKPFDRNTLIARINEFFIKREANPEAANIIPDSEDLLFGMDAENLMKLYADFYVKTEEDLSLMKRYSAERSFEKLMKISHSLKSSAGMLIGRKCVEILDEIDKISEKGIVNSDTGKIQYELISQKIAELESIYYTFKNSALVGKDEI